MRVALIGFTSGSPGWSVSPEGIVDCYAQLIRMCSPKCKGVAEHAVFNVAIKNASRLAVEAIQYTRLCSYTERSQSNINCYKRYHVPSAIIGSALEAPYRRAMANLLAAYNQLVALGVPVEDACYVLPLSAETDLEMILNACMANCMIQRCMMHPLAEVNDFAAQLHKELSTVAPTLIHALGTATPQAVLPSTNGNQEWEKLHRAVLHAGSLIIASDGMPPQLCPDRLVNARFNDLVQIGFKASVSGYCFTQLKHHRMTTIVKELDYDQASKSYVEPPSLAAQGAALCSEVFNDAIKISRELYQAASMHGPQTMYCLTNANSRQVFISMNLHNFARFCRLSMDNRVPWEIRGLAKAVQANSQECLRSYLCY